MQNDIDDAKDRLRDQVNLSIMEGLKYNDLENRLKRLSSQETAYLSNSVNESGGLSKYLQTFTRLAEKERDSWIDLIKNK